MTNTQTKDKDDLTSKKLTNFKNENKQSQDLKSKEKEKACSQTKSQKLKLDDINKRSKDNLDMNDDNSNILKHQNNKNLVKSNYNKSDSDNESDKKSEDNGSKTETFEFSDDDDVKLSQTSSLKKENFD